MMVTKKKAAGKKLAAKTKPVVPKRAKPARAPARRQTGSGWFRHACQFGIM